MARNLNAQNNTAREQRLLKFYVDGLKDNETKFDCLKDNGFLEAISKYAARPTASFEQFLDDIDHVATEQKYAGKRFVIIIIIPIVFNQRRY